MAKNNAYYNREGYYDPTAGKAISNVDRAVHRKKLSKKVGDVVAKEYAKKLYRSKKWQRAREYVLQRDNYICQQCKNSPAEEVHHVTWLTLNNIDNINVTIDPNNLVSLCRDCHFEVHKASIAKQSKKAANFRKEKEQADTEFYFDESGMLVSKKVYLVTGCYGSGKNYYVKNNMSNGDLVVDLDLLYMALSYQDMHCTPGELLFTVWDVKDYLYTLIADRKGNWKTAWIIAALPDKKKRLELAEYLKAEVIHIETDKETCIKNILDDISRKNKNEHMQYVQNYYEKFS